TVQNENQTLASITFQNYFRLYPKLAGMTGTAMTESQEFSDIYKLDVIEIPTNEPCIRGDTDDEVYRTTREKYDAIVQHVQECQERKQPMLIGTVSIEKSEALSAVFKQHKIPHNVLNARYHEQEAYIIAQAGRPGTVTIATNMAGRGTDIQLGGNLDMRLKTDLAPIEDAVVRETRAAAIREEIAMAHEDVVEARNYAIRKQLLKFDDVMNDQRKVIYEQRKEIMSARDVAETVADMRGETIAEMVVNAIPDNSLAEQWDLAGLHAECLRLLAL